MRCDTARWSESAATRQTVLHRAWGAPRAPRRASFVAPPGRLKPHTQAVSRGAAPLPTATHMRSYRFCPKALLLYEHVFCSPATSTLVQRARIVLSLTRSFLLLEDDDPVDWEVDGVERRIDGEPAWARAHRRQLRERRAVPGLVRRAGQATPRPQPCLCPILNEHVGSSRGYRPVGETSCRPAQRGSSTTTGRSRLAIDL